MSAQVTAMGIRDGDPAVLAALVERRGGAVLAYCERYCAPSLALDAASDSFARFRATVVATERPGDLDPEAALLGATRHAAAARSPRPAAEATGGLSRVFGNRGSTQRLPEVPDLLAARAEGTITPEDAAALDELLRVSPVARSIAERFEEAEEAYRTAPRRDIPGPILDQIVAAMVALAAPPPIPTTEVPGPRFFREDTVAHDPFTPEPVEAFEPEPPRVEDPPEVVEAEPVADAAPPRPDPFTMPAPPGLFTPTETDGDRPWERPAPPADEPEPEPIAAADPEPSAEEAVVETETDEADLAEGAAGEADLAGDAAGDAGEADLAEDAAGDADALDEDLQADAETDVVADEPDESGLAEDAAVDADVIADDAAVEADEVDGVEDATVEIDAIAEVAEEAEAEGELAAVEHDAENEPADAVAEVAAEVGVDGELAHVDPEVPEDVEEDELENVAGETVEFDVEDEPVLVDEADPDGAEIAAARGEHTVEWDADDVDEEEDEEDAAHLQSASGAVAEEDAEAPPPPAPAPPAHRHHSLGRAALAPAAAVVAIAAIGAMVASGVFGGNDPSPPVDTGIVPERALQAVPEGEAATVVDDLRSAASDARRRRLADLRQALAARPIEPAVPDTTSTAPEDTGADTDETGTDTDTGTTTGEGTP